MECVVEMVTALVRIEEVAVVVVRIMMVVLVELGSSDWGGGSRVG